MTPAEMTEYLRSRIPLTAAMDIRVLDCGVDRVRVAAPLAPNLNHRNTAFGGSLATLGILSGWALLHFGLREQGIKDAKLVIQKTECEYLEPVAGEFVAESRLPQDEWPRFAAALAKGRRARITVGSEITAAGQLAVRAAGTFVALP